jgi:transcriptional regulator with XRE-family HTH domain
MQLGAMTTHTTINRPFYRAIGKRIAALRKERELTQRELGERLGLTQGAVFNYEIAVTRVPAAVLVDLTRIFDVSIEHLLGLAPAPRLSRGSPAQRRHVDDMRQLPKRDRLAVMRIIRALAKSSQRDAG